MKLRKPQAVQSLTFDGFLRTEPIVVFELGLKLATDSETASLKVQLGGSESN